MSDEPIAEPILTPEPITPAVSIPSPPEIEPLPGFDTFAQTAALGMPIRAALRRWMLIHHHDPHGHYTLALWREYLNDTMNYS